MMIKLNEVTEALGLPDRHGDNWAVYSGDCLELLAALPKGSMPLTVTSPPYNIGKSYEQERDVGEYIDWCAEWVSLVHRATAPNGAFG